MPENLHNSSNISFGEGDSVDGLMDFISQLSPEMKLTTKLESKLDGKKIIKISHVKSNGISQPNKSETDSQIYKLLIEHSTSAIFLSKPNGKVIDVNSAATKMFGHTKNEFLLLGREGIIDHTDERVPKLLKERSETGKTTGEIIGIEKGGRRFPIEFTSAIFSDQHGEEFTCTIMQDITIRKKVEEQVLLMLNNTDESFILLDKDLIILNFNKQFKQLYKKYFNVIIKKGRSIIEYVQPERLDSAKEIYKKALAGETVLVELPFKTANGNEHFFAFKYSPSKDADNNLVGIFVTIRDITVEKKAQIEIAKQQDLLRQAEANYREMFEKANDAIFIHELETGKLLDLNTKGCELFGKTKAEILEADPSIFATDTKGYTHDVAISNFEKAAAGIPQLFEWISRHSDGTLNWVEVSLQKASIAGADRILAYYRLINDRKNVETQMELQRKDKEALINNTDDLIWSIDFNYKLIAANNAYLNMMNMVSSTTHKVGSSVMIREFGDTLNEKWESYYQRALSGEKYSVEDEFIHPKTNKASYELLSFNPIFELEKVIGVACYSKNITELTENQIAVKTTKAELDNVMASSQDMICTVGKDNRIMRVSAASEIILGYKPEELIGKFIFDFVYEEDKTKTITHAQEVMAGKPKPNYYNRYVRKDGSLVYLEWTAKWDEQSNKRYGVARDVSAKVEAENNLKNSEQRFKRLVQDGSDLIAILNLEATYTYVSPTSVAILGFHPEEFIEKNAFDFIHPDDTQIVMEQFQLLQTNRKITLPAFRFKNKIGEWRWIETTLTNLIDEPAINGIVANSRDITERIIIQKALIVSKENYKNLFENSPAPMFIFDFETLQIIDCNEETLIKYGYSKTEFLQLTIKDIRPVEDLYKIEEAVENEETYGRIHRKIWRHNKKNGEIMYMDITGHMIDYDGKRVSLVMLIDVTEKLAIERQSEKEKLDREAALILVKEKDAKLENAQQIAKLGYWQRNLITNSVYWSREIFNIWEVEEDTIPDFDFFIASIHPNDIDSYLVAEDNAVKNNAEIDEEFRIVTASGKIKWIHEKARTETNKDGQVVFLQGTAQDITERKNDERKLFESNQRYEHVTKATYDAIWEWDVISNKIYRAKGFETSFGFDLSELNSPETLWENFIHQEDRHTANESIKEAIHSNEDYWSHEYRIIKPNGEQAYVEDRAYILRNEKGSAQRIIGALRDITERKYYHDLEILEREILETKARGEIKIEEVVEKYILGIEKLHVGMIGSMQKLENNRLYNIASPGLSKQYLEKINGAIIGENEGSCGTAAYWKEKVIVSDIANDPRWIKYKQVAEAEGLKACWSHPVMDSKHHVIATFAIYYKTEKVPSPFEINTLNRGVNILQTLLESYEREAALKESNQRYLNVTKATFDAIWDWDIITDNIFWGETYWQLFGNVNDSHLSSQERVHTRLHPDEKELVMNSAKEALAGKLLNWSMEHRYLKADGSYAYVYNKALIVRDENGRAIRVFGAMQDITKQKEEEQRLKLMSSVVTSTNDAVLITEAEPLNEPGPRIMYVNEAFCKMTGYSSEELIGQTPRVLQGPKTDMLEMELLAASLRKWEPYEATVINYKKNGEEFWINFTVSPVADEKGWYTHWISVERDVTERKNDELQKELLRKIRIIFNAPISIKESLDKVLKEVTLFGDFCFAESWLLSPDKKEIKRATYYVADAVMRTSLNNNSKLNVQSKGDGLVGAAWETLEPQTWEAGIFCKNILDEDVLINAGVKKLYALPFLNNTEMVGVIVFGINKIDDSIFKFENLFNSLKIYLGAEIRRKQLEQELNQIFNFAPDIIATIGHDGYFKKLNPAASDLLEYSLEDLMAIPFINFVHPEDRDNTMNVIDNLQAGKITQYFENRYITKSGKVKWLAWTNTPSQEEELIFSVAKNITEKKDLEVVLDKANQLARIGSWEMDLEKGTMYWSDMTKEIHEASYIFLPTLQGYFDAYDSTKIKGQMHDAFKNAVNNGTPWDLELEIITEKGNKRWVRSIGEAEFEHGKCIKIYGSLQDINPRKQAEESIRSSEERRELIMNAALDAIVCVDKNGNITFWNPQAEFIFGWQENEVIGKKLSAIIIPDQYKSRHNDGMENYFRTGQGNVLNVLLQLSAIRKNGEEFPVELTVLPIEQDGEEFFCGFMRDITERKMSETRLLELNHSLQIQTQELAGINKELEQFAYVASHDLQEPLRMITSFITQLEKKYSDVLDEKGKKYIYFAVDGAQRMRHIILDLLEYSKIGRIDELKQHIDLNEIIDEIKILYANKIEEHQAQIIYHDLPVISSYKSPLKQVFQNIISNSLKYYNAENGCKIEILSKDIGTHWEFSISDNGIGINKDYFDKIFIIFQRLHTKELYSGTGMGLAVTKKIIENLQGKIWVESTEGKGSKFSFTLPKS